MACAGAAGRGAPRKAREYVGLGPRPPGMRVGVLGMRAAVDEPIDEPIDEPLRRQMAFAFGVASDVCMRVHAIRGARPLREFLCRDSAERVLRAWRTAGPRLTLRFYVDVLRAWLSCVACRHALTRGAA